MSLPCNFCQRLHWKFSKLQFSMQPGMEHFVKKIMTFLFQQSTSPSVCTLYPTVPAFHTLSFTVISQTGTSPSIVSSLPTWLPDSPDLPAGTLAWMIAWMKDNPNKTLWSELEFILLLLGRYQVRKQTFWSERDFKCGVCMKVWAVS